MLRKTAPYNRTNTSEPRVQATTENTNWLATSPQIQRLSLSSTSLVSAAIIGVAGLTPVSIQIGAIHGRELSFRNTLFSAGSLCLAAGPDPLRKPLLLD
jgi:hypothetical protein